MKPRARIKAPRIVFNGDCNFFFYNPELWQPDGGAYRAEAIHRCVRQLAASGIDALAINPNTQVAWYPSRTMPHILQGYRRGDLAFARRIARANAAIKGANIEPFAILVRELLDRYLDLAERGADWLAECAKTCRETGIAPWLSYRMNPTHFSGRANSPVNSPVFRDPRNRLSGRVPTTGKCDHAWVGLNYARVAVRDYMRELILDGVRGYDYEGVELDWLRHPVCMESPTRRNVAAMTEWIADLRRATRRRGQKLGLRIPANLDYLRGIGLDVRAMARRGLLDFICVSNFWQHAWTQPLDALRAELGGDLLIYGGIEGAPNWTEAVAPSLRERQLYQELQLAGDSAHTAEAKPKGPQRIRGTRYLAASPELLRGAAAGQLSLGADGVELFNFYVADQVRVKGQKGRYEAIRGIGSLTSLRGHAKHYCLNTASGNAHELWDTPAPLPAEIPAGESRTFVLPAIGESSGRLRLTIQLIARLWPKQARINLLCNGHAVTSRGRRATALLFPSGPYSHHVPENHARDFDAPIRLLRNGRNEIRIDNRGRTALRLVGLEVGLYR